MKTVTSLLVIGAVATLALPAHAEYVRATWSGAVEEVGQGAPTGIAVGTPITFSAVYDTAKLVDHTASLNDALGFPYVTDFKSASLSDDPHAQLNITVGSVSFTKFDQLFYGTPESDCGPGCDLGAGNFPVVEYFNEVFRGVGNIFINAQHYSLDADPIAYDLSGGFGLDGPGAGPYQFYLGTGDFNNPFTTGYAVGSIDPADVVFTDLGAAIPEPAAWVMMLTGVGILGSALRRRAALA